MPDNEEPTEAIVRKQKVLIGTGFVAPPPNKGGATGYKEKDVILVQKALEGIKQGRYNNAHDAASQLCNEIEGRNTEQISKIRRLGDRIRKIQNDE